jgi:hypothetical protein
MYEVSATGDTPNFETAIAQTPTVNLSKHGLNETYITRDPVTDSNLDNSVFLKHYIKYKYSKVTKCV